MGVGKCQAFPLVGGGGGVYFNVNDSIKFRAGVLILPLLLQVNLVMKIA